MALLTPFLLIPVVELTVFILVCLLVGFWTAALLVLAGSITGVLLLRFHGAATLRRAQRQVDRQQADGRLFHGLWLAAAGLLLLIPGFVTDLLALALLLPPLRRALARPLFGRLQAWNARMAATRPRATPSDTPTTPSSGSPGLPPGPIIDVAFEDLPPNPPLPR